MNGGRDWKRMWEIKTPLQPQRIREEKRGGVLRFELYAVLAWRCAIRHARAFWNFYLSPVIMYLYGANVDTTYVCSENGLGSVVSEVSSKMWQGTVESTSTPPLYPWIRYITTQPALNPIHLLRTLIKSVKIPPFVIIHDFYPSPPPQRICIYSPVYMQIRWSPLTKLDWLLVATRGVAMPWFTACKTSSKHDAWSRNTFYSRQVNKLNVLCGGNWVEVWD